MGPLLAALAPGIPSLIGAIGGMFGANAQAKAERRNVQENQERTIKANREMAEYEYSKNLEMWNLGNAYNSPEAQMKRLQGAGLNPNLVYGTGAVGNSSAQLPRYNAPQIEYSAPAGVDYPGMISQFQDVQIKQAQYDNLRAQRKAIGEDIIAKQMANDVYRKAEGKVVEYPGHEGLGAISGGLVNKAEKSHRDWLIAQGKLQKMQEDVKYYPEMAKSQLEYSQGRVYSQEAGINKVLQDTELSKLKTDYFVADAISSIAGRTLGPLLKIFGGGAKAAGKAAPSLNRKLSQSQRRGPYWSGYKSYRQRNP